MAENGKNIAPQLQQSFRREKGRVVALVLAHPMSAISLFRLGCPNLIPGRTVRTSAQFGSLVWLLGPTFGDCRPNGPRGVVD